MAPDKRTAEEGMRRVCTDESLYVHLWLTMAVKESVIYFKDHNKILEILLLFAQADDINPVIVRRAFYKLVNYHPTTKRGLPRSMRMVYREVIEMIWCIELAHRILWNTSREFKYPIYRKSRAVWSDQMAKAMLHKRSPNRLPQGTPRIVIYYVRFMRYFERFSMVLDETEKDTLFYVFNRMLGYTRYLDRSYYDDKL